MNDERRKQTEQKLIESGKAEFLEKGYAKANLRDICKAAGMKDLKVRSTCRCGRHLPVIFLNLWETARMQNLSGFWFP